MSNTGLWRFTWVVTAFVVIDALWNPIVLGTAFVAPDLFREYVTPRASTVDGGALIFKLATFAIFAAWIYTAGRKLAQRDEIYLEFSAASRIWWFFVPVASLWKPFEGMRELWNASRGVEPHDRNNWLIGIWWISYLAVAITGVVGNAVAGSGGQASLMILFILYAIEAARATVAIPMIHGIAAGLSGAVEHRLVEVFA